MQSECYQSINYAIFQKTIILCSRMIGYENFFKRCDCIKRFENIFTNLNIKVVLFSFRDHNIYIVIVTRPF